MTNRFGTSNNQAAYEALIAGLKPALSFHVHRVTVYYDSLLVVQQIKGDFQVKDPLLERYCLIAKDLISKFDEFTISHVNREKNTRVDILSKLAATRANTHTSALAQLILENPSIESLCIMNITHTNNWRMPFLEYIRAGTIPRDETSPQIFKRKARFYIAMAGKLYRRGFSQPLLKCLGKDEANEVMTEIQEGVSGNHIEGRALAAKIV
ncbi:uncharacterized protein [Arachis hypogaea]|uniref:uncharacterized protein n=1 Tax=Arachis hypogaea TaxID=3818 RepID=UPI003B21307A